MPILHWTIDLPLVVELKVKIMTAIGQAVTLKPTTKNPLQTHTCCVAKTDTTPTAGSAQPDATLPRYENERVAFHDMQTQLQRSDLILRLL